MGQKVNPHGARVGVIKGWDARWFADKKEFANYIAEDDRLRKYLKKKLYTVGISKIEIERKANSTTVFLYTAEPTFLISKGGVGSGSQEGCFSRLYRKACQRQCNGN